MSHHSSFIKVVVWWGEKSEVICEMKYASMVTAKQCFADFCAKYGLGYCVYMSACNGEKSQTIMRRTVSGELWSAT